MTSFWDTVYLPTSSEGSTSFPTVFSRIVTLLSQVLASKRVLFNFDIIDIKTAQAIKSGSAESALFDKIPTVFTPTTAASPATSTKPTTGTKEAKDTKDAKNTTPEKILAPEMI